MAKSLPPAESIPPHEERIPDIVAALLREKVSIRQFHPGDPIVDPADAGDRIRFVLAGRAEVVVGYRLAQEVIVDNLGPGDVFGDLSFLTGREWPADAQLIAIETATVLDIPVDSFQRVLRENPEFTVSLLRLLAKRTFRVERSEFISPAKVEGTDSAPVCAYRAHPGMPEEVQSRFRDLAVSNRSVLIAGENGVGKDILAYAIFDAADSHREVFVPVDVRRIGSESFFQAAEEDAKAGQGSRTADQIRFLFGEEAPDEQGDSKVRPGYLDLSDEGTLFVRGVHLLTAVTQQKLLDALKTGVYCPLGSDRKAKVDFRLVCTTDIHPSQITFGRHPLLKDLETNALVLPALRERREQIPDLARHYLGHYAQEMGREAPDLPEITLKALTDYSWPGNDLELANAMRRAVLLSRDDVVRRQDLTFDQRRTDGSGRYNLLRLQPLRQAILSPLFPAILQSAFLPVFLAIVLLLLLGPPEPSKNLAATVMWAFAWPGMIVAALFGARIWCSVCAIGALSKLAKRIVALDIPFPEALKMRSDFLIAGGILTIIWMEGATDIRSSPFNLGLLLCSMFLVAFVLNTLYTRQAWCRYLCPLGGMTGLLARTSLIELRADAAVCLSSCATHDCYYGTAKNEGCPFGQVVASLHSNHFCKICAACAKNCPYDAIRLNLRLPGHELWEVRHVRTGTGFLVLGLLGGVLADILSRTTIYEHATAWLPASSMLRFTVTYLVLITVVNVLFLASSLLSHRVYRERFLENYSRFALTLLPLTCMGILAFHVYYLVNLGTQLPYLLSQLFGSAAARIPAVEVPGGVTLWVRHALVAIGLAWTLITMYLLGRSSPRGRYPRRLGIVPHALVATILACGLVWAMMESFPG